VQFDGHGLEIRQAAPGIGEHTDDVLREAGLVDREIDALRRAGAVA
jgi:formyl-CoA transferase